MVDVISDLLTALTDLIPRLAGAVTILLGALLLAFAACRLVSELLENLGLDTLFERAGVSNPLWRLGYTGGPSRVFGLTIFWAIVLTGVASSLNILGLSSLENTMSQIVNLLGRGLVALIVMVVGTAAASWLSDLVARETEGAGMRGANVFRRVVFIAVISVAALIAASQLGLETYALILIATIVLASIGLAAALALGQGLVLLSGNIAASRYVQDGISTGDTISVTGIEGTVEELGYASVTLRSEDGYLYRIPNRTLLENIVRKQG